MKRQRGDLCLLAWTRAHLVENVDEEWERVATRWGERYGTAANGG